MPIPLPHEMLDKVHDLTLACLSGEASPEEVTELNELLRSDKTARRIYAYAILDSSRLRRWAAATSLHSTETFDGGELDAEIAGDTSFSSIAKDGDRDTIPDASFPFLGNVIHGPVGYFSSDCPVAYLVATVILGIGLLIGAFVHVSSPVQVVDSTLPSPSSTTHYPPSTTHSTVGRITGMVDCQWSDPNTAAFSGASVPLGRKYALSSGLMEITYNTGAKVILQGPVTYEVESSDGGYLSVGKLTARVEKKAGERNDREGSRSRGYEVRSRNRTADHSDVLRTPYSVLPAGPSPLSTLHSQPSALRLPPSALFFVRTPTAVVTDLGTEFGVEVSKEGNTTSHVFRGTIEVRTTSTDGKTNVDAKILHANESARVDGSQGQYKIVTVPAVKPAEFMHIISKPRIITFDLVDVVAGGDGFSGRRNRGIDPTNGQIADASLPPDNPAFILAGDGKYHRTETLPFVDGVFIPNAKFGPVQIDSSGRTFNGFLDTEGTTSGYVWAGGSIPSSPVHRIPTTLDGIDYASPGHGLLFLHANKGMTFDLQSIRRANPDYRITRFRAIAGNVEVGSEAGLSVSADAWVLVDGQPRFRRREVNRSCGAMPASIPIGPNDRFLTLVATDGENGIAGDWILFGDPQLELTSIRTGFPTGNTEGH